MLILVEFQLCCGENLNCDFKNSDYELAGSLYSCFVSPLDNSDKHMTLTGSWGVHLTNKNNNEVKAIYISFTNVKFIPTNLESIFNLKALTMHATNLFEIKSSDFHGMQELEHLYLGKNELTSISSNVFSTLPKLRYINLYTNKLEELPHGLFDNNINLEEIHLDYNKIKYIPARIFDYIKKLNRVYLSSNICIDKSFNGGSINQFKNDIEASCFKPIEVTLFEMQEKNQNLEKVQQEKLQVTKERDAIKVELSNAKDVQLKMQMQIDLLISKISMQTSLELNIYNINCDFKKQNNGYSCSTQGLVINQRDMELDEVNREHLTYRTNSNVTELSIDNSTVSFWSNKIFLKFPALQSLYIHNSQMKELIKEDFNFASKLTFLEVHGNEIRILGNHVF